MAAAAPHEAMAEATQMPKPWENPVGASNCTLAGPTFNETFPSEFRESGIKGAGRGWFAVGKIPKGTRLRRLSVKDGSLLRFESYEDLMGRTGWTDFRETVHYAIGLASSSSESVPEGSPLPLSSGNGKEASSIYFLNPGTACNHAFPMPASIEYRFSDGKATGGDDTCELWTCRDVDAGEEMFIDYSQAFSKCTWYDERARTYGDVPLSWLAEEIRAMADNSGA
eukprot:TRINITY_DN19045_c0_g1_i1.p1 TRINITY_DN19045_c0_g1~~TRINITY_DN19045_c0_g1_i1.p1  ORF type:complete len:225 (-),score=21.15 TRINITY_DN19045_c0_g1_i1:389-1063(-)